MSFADRLQDQEKVEVGTGQNCPNFMLLVLFVLKQRTGFH